MRLQSWPALMLKLTGPRGVHNQPHRSQHLDRQSGVSSPEKVVAIFKTTKIRRVGRDLWPRLPRGAQVRLLKRFSDSSRVPRMSQSTHRVRVMQSRRWWCSTFLRRRQSRVCRRICIGRRPSTRPRKRPHRLTAAAAQPRPEHAKHRIPHLE